MTISVSRRLGGTILTTIEHEGMFLWYYQNATAITVEFNDTITGFKTINPNCNLLALQDLIYLFQHFLYITNSNALILI